MPPCPTTHAAKSTPRRPTRRLGVMAVLGIVLALTSRHGAAAGEPEGLGRLRVLVHPGQRGGVMPVETLRNIYLGKQDLWENKVKVVVIGRSIETSAGKLFYRLIMHMAPMRYHLYWQQRELAGGESVSPLDVDDVQELRKIIALQPGAISIVTDLELRELSTDGVRVLEILPAQGPPTP